MFRFEHGFNIDVVHNNSGYVIDIMYSYVWSMVTGTQKNVVLLLFECMVWWFGSVASLVFKVRCTNYSQLFMHHTVTFVYCALVIFLYLFFSFFANVHLCVLLVQHI